jgi:hypothetical protein
MRDIQPGGQERTRLVHQAFFPRSTQPRKILSSSATQHRLSDFAPAVFDAHMQRSCSGRDRIWWGFLPLREGGDGVGESAPSHSHCKRHATTSMFLDRVSRGDESNSKILRHDSSKAFITMTG